jgi:hypothetical protein
VLVAPFLSWVHVILLGNLDLFNLISATHSRLVWALIPMGLAFAVLVGALRGSRGSRALTVISGVVGALVNGVLLVALLHELRHAYGLAQVGSGPWIGVGGAVLMFGASVKRWRPFASRSARTQ